MTQANNTDAPFDNHSNDTFLLFKLKILNDIKFIRDRKKRADLEAIFDHRITMEASNADKALVENLLSKLINCKLIMSKKTRTSLDSFRLITEVQSEFRTAVDKESQTENQYDVHKEILNENNSSLILENSILPINIKISNSSGIMNKSLLSQD